MARTLTDVDVLDQLRRLVDHHGSLRAAAAKLKLSHQYLNAVLNGKREIGPRLLDALHIREVITYEERPILPSERNSHTAILEQNRRSK
jgi:transcriptional regulator with XRE-family HTH domain